MSVQGTLSRLSAAVDLSQYRLIRGLLSYNIGECLDDIDAQVTETSFNTSSHSALASIFNRCTFYSKPFFSLNIKLFI